MQELGWDLFDEALSQKDIADSATGITYSAQPSDGQRGPMMSRRTLCKAAAVVAAAGVLGFGARYFFPPANRFTYRTPNRTLNYYRPDSGEEIQFINESQELPFLPPVDYQWFVDERIISRERNCSSKLPATRVYDKNSQEWIESAPHTVKLTTHRGFVSSSTEQMISVDPETLPEYPERKLRIPIKGIAYIVGMNSWEMPAVSNEEIEESLAIIQRLGCNGLRVVGDIPERLTKCTELALDKFDTILLSPFAEELTLEEVQKRTTTLAKDAETLRGRSNKSRLVMSVGNELLYELQGIIPGKNYNERNDYIAEFGLNQEQIGTLSDILKTLTGEASQHFKGELSYDSSMLEGMKIDWKNIGVDVLSPHRYYETEWTTESDYLETIKWFIQQASGRDVFISELGYFTFDEALRWGADGWNIATKYPVKYSQEAQASALNINMELLNLTDVKGIFLWDFLQKKTDDKSSPGIIKYNKDGLWERKLSSILYESWKV